MNRKRWLGIAAVALIGTLFGGLALDAARANARRGKVYYKKHCRVCHDGATAGAAELSPMTKTMEQWNRAFAPGGAAGLCVPRVKQKLAADLTEQDLLDMQSYLVQHAADSDQPATCGN